MITLNILFDISKIHSKYETITLNDNSTKHSLPSNDAADWKSNN